MSGNWDKCNRKQTHSESSAARCTQKELKRTTTRRERERRTETQKQFFFSETKENEFECKDFFFFFPFFISFFSIYTKGKGEKLFSTPTFMLTPSSFQQLFLFQEKVLRRKLMIEARKPLPYPHWQAAPPRPP